MTRTNAKQSAQAEANRYGLTLALVREGLHADDFAERDTDGESYGFCPLPAVPVLYRFGQQIETITPKPPR